MSNKDPFPVSRTLLNPKFESYKLAPATPGVLFALPTPDAILPTVPDHARFSFAEVQYRARHNHLSAGKGGECLYVDAERAVTAVELDQHGAVHFHSLLQLPTFLSTSSSLPAPEYPTALSLSSTLWAISDGHGRLYAVRVSKHPWIAIVTSSFELTNPDGSLAPFRIHHVALDAQGHGRALLSQSVRVETKVSPKVAGPGGPGSTSGGMFRAKIESTTAFDWVAVDLGPVEELVQGDHEAVRSWREAWRLRCTELPRFAQWDSARSGFIVGAPSLPLSPSAPPPPTSSSVPVPNTPSAPPPHPSIFSPAKPSPPPYSWTQDTSSLTLAFPLPSSTPTSSIRLTFSPHFLTLHIGSAAAVMSNETLPHLSHAKLWAPIDAHSSLWTFDREAEGRDSSYGLLSLHLEKGHAGTRWPSVFAAGELPEVPETLDPTELANIVDMLEKYTESSESVGLDGRPAGDDPMQGGVPTSLRGDEMDVDVDGDAGTPFLVCFVSDSGVVDSQHPAFERALLSVPLPVATASPEASSVILKHDVDGLAFDPPSNGQSDEWTHTSTFPALAFVLATKTTAKFVFHLTSSSSAAVLAFDSPSSAGLGVVGSTAGGGSNLFVYFRPMGKALTGRQLVVRVGGPGSGALLGAVAVEAAGQRKLVVLFERELGIYTIF